MSKSRIPDREKAHGSYKRTHAYMIQGCGAKMEWKTRVKRNGEYEVYAFLPPKISVNRVTEEDSNPYALKKEELSDIKQHYIISCDGKEEKVVVEIGEQTGWVLLGRYKFKNGVCKIILTDEGQPYQILQGDAMKWTPVNE